MSLFLWLRVGSDGLQQTQSPCHLFKANEFCVTKIDTLAKLTVTAHQAVNLCFNVMEHHLQVFIFKLHLLYKCDLQ